MDYRLFVESTVCSMDKSVFEKCKSQLIENGITFAVLEPEQVTEAVMAEKLCDYFETLGIKTDKAFDKQVESYMSKVDAIVSPHIEKPPQKKKGTSSFIVIPRATKYYEKATSLKKRKKPTYAQVFDYSRIMFCLFSEVVKNNKDKGAIVNNLYPSKLENFDYSVECLDPIKIISAMKLLTIAAKIGQWKRMFNLNEIYSLDTATIIISILMLWSIINASGHGDDNRE